MDWNSIDWQYLGMISVLAVIVGGFSGAGTYLFVNWHRARVQRRERAALSEQARGIVQAAEAFGRFGEALKRPIPRKKDTERGA